MRSSLVAGLVVLGALASWNCGGGSSGSSPAAPSGTTATSSTGTITISIMGVKGVQSFSPNPASVDASQTVVWHNADTITHRVLLNNGSVDTLDLAPGASSAPMRLGGDAQQYHCTIHPNMVGSVNTATNEPPPCTGAYC